MIGIRKMLYELNTVFTMTGNTVNFMMYGLSILLLNVRATKELQFGEGFTQLHVTEIDVFPPVEDFIKNYVLQSKPFVIRNGALISPAFYKWNDAYFLSLNASQYEVICETVKKESRKDHYGLMYFNEFVKLYNKTEIYMVDTVPTFLRKDILIPCSLQSPSIQVANTVMWYSSGGTKSVVHTDNIDNLNCLYRGKKHFILIDKKHYQNVDLDYPLEGYSSIDVDNVDFDKFPGLLKVEYYNVTVNAGDCLYIPYLWIHQVRSYDNNLAVNMWFDHFEAIKINEISNKSPTCNVALSLENLKFTKTRSKPPGMIKDLILSFIGIHEHMSREMFVKSLFPSLSFSEPTPDKATAEQINVIFQAFDNNQNEFVSREEINNYKQWDRIAEDINKVGKRKVSSRSKDEEQHLSSDRQEPNQLISNPNNDLSGNIDDLPHNGEKSEL